MLFLIVEGLTCICPINDVLIQICVLKKTPHRRSCKYCFYSTSRLLNPSYFFLSLLSVKSKCWMEKMSTTNYCQLWSQSPRKSTRLPPPPTLSSGPTRQSELSLTTMSTGKTDAPDMQTDTPKSILSVGCAAVCGASSSSAE